VKVNPVKSEISSSEWNCGGNALLANITVTDFENDEPSVKNSSREIATSWNSDNTPGFTSIESNINEAIKDGTCIITKEIYS